MRMTRLRSMGKTMAAVLCAACFLSMNLGAFSRAVAADPWETWPKKASEPVMERKLPDDAAGEKSAAGISYGTIGWIALGIAAAIGIGIAASGGGGDSGGGTVVNPGHH